MATINSLAPELLSEIFGHLEVYAFGHLPSLSINSTCKFPTSAAALRLRPLAIRNLRHLTFDIDEELIYNEVVLLPSRHSLVFLLLEALDLVTSAYLLEVLGSQPFPLVRHLALFGLKAFEVWSALSIASFPSLVTLEFGGLQTDIKNALGAAHATPPTPHTLIFTHPLLYAEEGCCADLLRFIKLPSLEALRRIEIAMVPKDELAGESGLALLDDVMATVDSLAAELLSDIMGHLEVDILGDALHGDLCNAALVCRKWREPAQRAMFRTVVLERGDQLNIRPLKKLSDDIALARLDDGNLGAHLANYFAIEQFPLVRHLILDCVSEYDFWPVLIRSFPALVTLEIADQAYFEQYTSRMSVVAVGASALPTLQNLIFDSRWMDEYALLDLNRIIKFPNLEGLRRIEMVMVSKEELAGATGLALLDECKERSISLLCRYGWL
ncbi:hypothetical protein RQP46_010285 [Phenoliferia psychrophenolica]